MKRINCLLLSCILLLCLTACKSSQIQSTDLTGTIDSDSVQKRSSDDQFIASQMSFAVKLFQSSVQKDANKNVLISPLSVVLALAMTANGADGKTKTEMESVLAKDVSIEELNEYLHTYIDSLPSNKDSKLQLANSIWYRDSEGLTINDDFLQKNADYYDAQIYTSEFNEQTLKDINTWVNENTDGMIEQILNQIDPAAVMYLINALCFDAEWETPYESHQVRDNTFTSIDGEKQQIAMMYGDESFYLSDAKATGFIKDYKDAAYRFAALLPNEDVSITDYISSLTYDGLLQTLQNAEETAVETGLPKFEGKYEITLNDILKTMGMPSAFDSEKADFSKMGTSDVGNLYIDFVLHKTFISVDELGTEAGAATVVAMGSESAAIIEKQVILNRPFVYMILDGETNLPIFIGTVINLAD